MTAFRVRYNALAALRYGRTNTDPPGANRWGCTVPGLPVVLLGGLGINAAVNWYTLSPLLANAGLRVFALDWGNYGHGYATRGKSGVGDITRAATELDAFVDQVRAHTGATKVALVGHSAGGLLAQYYIKRRGGDEKVSHFVGLAPTVHGTTICGLLKVPGARQITARVAGENILQQAAGSAFNADLHADADTIAGISYTVISPSWDIFTTPIRSQQLDGPAVTNIRLRNLVDHLLIAFNKRALAHVVAALGVAP